MAVTPLFLSKEYLPSVADTEEYARGSRITGYRIWLGEATCKGTANINHKNWDINQVADIKIYCILFLSFMLLCRKVAT